MELSKGEESNDSSACFINRLKTHMVSIVQFATVKPGILQQGFDIVCI